MPGKEVEKELGKMCKTICKKLPERTRESLSKIIVRNMRYYLSFV